MTANAPVISAGEARYSCTVFFVRGTWGRGFFPKEFSSESLRACAPLC
jgi:hypothetical protein